MFVDLLSSKHCPSVHPIPVSRSSGLLPSPCASCSAPGPALCLLENICMHSHSPHIHRSFKLSAQAPSLPNAHAWTLGTVLASSPAWSLLVNFTHLRPHALGHWERMSIQLNAWHPSTWTLWTMLPVPGVGAKTLISPVADTAGTQTTLDWGLAPVSGTEFSHSCPPTCWKHSSFTSHDLVLQALDHGSPVSILHWRSRKIQNFSLIAVWNDN